MSQKRNIGKYSVALLAPTSTGQYGQVIEGFQDTLKEILPEAFVCPFYLLGAQRESVRACLYQVVQDKYDLVVTMGVSTGKLVANYFDKSNIDIPHILLGYATAIEDGLFQFEKNRTSVYYQVQSIKDYVDFFVFSCSKYKKVLGVMDEFFFKDPYSDSFEISDKYKNSGLLSYLESSDELRRYSFKNNFFMDIKQFASSYDLYRQVGIFKRHYEAMLFFEGSGFFEAIPILHNEKSEILIFSGLIEPVEKGQAPIGWGLNHNVLGVEAAKMAFNILEKGVAAGNINCLKINHKRLPAINLSLAKNYNLDLDKIVSYCKKNNGIIIEE